MWQQSLSRIARTDISDELVHIKKTLGDIEDKVSEIADAQNKEY